MDFITHDTKGAPSIDINSYIFLESFLDDVFVYEHAELNALEKAKSSGKLLVKYKEKISEMIAKLQSKINMLEHSHEHDKKMLSKEISDNYDRTESPENIIPKIITPKPMVYVNIMGRQMLINKFTTIDHVDHTSLYYCTKRKLLIARILGELFYFSNPASTSPDVLKCTVDCKSEMCRALPSKMCNFYHRSESYGTCYGQKNYLPIYLPKPFGKISPSIVSHYINSKSNKLTNLHFNVLKDYAMFLLISSMVLHQ